MMNTQAHLRVRFLLGDARLKIMLRIGGLLAMVLCGQLANAVEPARPNVLFLISDDLNNMLSCYGDPLVKTPHLDRLAARSVRFERAYCTYPLCGPSRNSMLTGLYPNSTGILENGLVFRQTIPHHHSLPQAFRLSGYFVGRIGKLYHYNVPRSIGTNGHDDPGSWELELNPAGADRLRDEPHIFSLRPGEFGGVLSWYASPHPEPLHTDALMAADAEWVLERCARQQDRPFFLAVGFYRPHTPYVAPAAYFAPYPLDKVPVVEGVAEDQQDLPPAALGSHKKEQEQLTDELRRQCRQAYSASITFMDAQVGKILAALDRLGLADNTIIVFTSDHGYHMGEHGLWQKRSLFEESARVPLLIAVPGKQRGAVASAPVSQVDLYPTLANLCGVAAPTNLQGQDITPMLEDVNHVGRGWAVTQVGRQRAANDGQLDQDPARRGRSFFGYSLRTERWRYTEWDEGHEGLELYDHAADPRELTNLAARPELQPIIQELSSILRTSVAASYPSTGVSPTVNRMPWAPNLTDP